MKLADILASVCFGAAVAIIFLCISSARVEASGCSAPSCTGGCAALADGSCNPSPTPANTCAGTGCSCTTRQRSGSGGEFHCPCRT